MSAADLKYPVISHRRHGDAGRWLVFVHGLTCAGDDWRRQIDSLAHSHRCLTVDLRGHGASAERSGPYDMETLAADVVRVLEAHDIDQAVLVGHSMGTRVIAAAAMQAPERVAGLVFVDGSRQGEGEPLVAQAAAAALFDDDDDSARFLANMFSAMFTARSNPAERKAIVARALALPTSRVRALMSNMAGWDAGRMPVLLSQLRIPLRVVQSTSVLPDRTRSSLEVGDTTPYLEAIRRWVPHATIEVVPATGHFTQLDAHEIVTAAILAMAHDT